MNKKGAEITVGTIIVIILALVVLVVLIYGFSTGWGNLWQNIIGLGGGKINVQTIVQNCQVACTTGSQFDFCTKSRNVVFAEKKDQPRFNQNGMWTCGELVTMSVGLDSCSNIECPITKYQTCADLKTTQCAGEDASKCDTRWADQTTIDKLTRDVGTVAAGKTYKTIDTSIDSAVTSKEDRLNNPSSKCIKAVKN